MSFLDQLNLTPQERRFVVFVAVVVFIVLNWWLVFPHFGDLGKVRKQLEDTRGTIQKWNDSIAKDNDPGTNGYKVILSNLERQQGGGIVNDQIQLQRTVSDQANKTGVAVEDIRPITAVLGKTNQFYDEQSIKITFQCQEANLVNFLYNVGNDAAKIRVRELNLHTADQNRYKLRGDAVLTANYAKPTPVAAKPAAAAAKPGDAKAPAPKTPEPAPKPVTRPLPPNVPRMPQPGPRPPQGGPPSPR